MLGGGAGSWLGWGEAGEPLLPCPDPCSCLPTAPDAGAGVDLAPASRLCWAVLCHYWGVPGAKGAFSPPVWGLS